MNNFKLYDIINNNLVILKGGYNYSGDNYVIIFICIIIAIGLFLYFNNNLIWLSTDATIISSVCNSDLQCNINITYNVNSIIYSKQIIADKYYADKSFLTIYYHENNPNVIKLYNFDYKIFGLSLIIISLIILLHSILFIPSNDVIISSEISLSSINTNDEIIYTK